MIRIDREDLLNRLRSVQYGLAKGRETAQQSSCVVFDRGYMLTYNDEISCRMKSPLGKEISGAVKAVPLIQLLEKLADENLGVSTEDNQLVVRAKRGLAEIAVDTEIVLATSVVEMPKEWQTLPDDFDEAVGLVSACAGTDESRFSLTCIHFGPKYLEACDNAQIARYRMKLGIQQDFLILRDSIKDLTSLGVLEFAETESWVHFRNKAGLIFSCRRFVERFPDFSKVFDMQGKAATLAPAVGNAAEIAGIFSAENSVSDKILVQLRQGKIRVRGEGVVGRYTEPVAIKYDGPSIEFRIRPKLLSEIVEKYHDCEITSDRLKVDGGKFTYVACLSVVGGV